MKCPQEEKNYQWIVKTVFIQIKCPSGLIHSGIVCQPILMTPKDETSMPGSLIWQNDSK